MNAIINAFNIKIAETRIKQKDISKITGISEQRLSRILSEHSKLLADEMLKLCAVLGVNPNELQPDTTNPATNCERKPA